MHSHPLPPATPPAVDARDPPDPDPGGRRSRSVGGRPSAAVVQRPVEQQAFAIYVPRHSPRSTSTSPIEISSSGSHSPSPPPPKRGRGRPPKPLQVVGASDQSRRPSEPAGSTNATDDISEKTSKRQYGEVTILTAKYRHETDDSDYDASTGETDDRSDPMSVDSTDDTDDSYDATIERSDNGNKEKVATTVVDNPLVARRSIVADLRDPAQLSKILCPQCGSDRLRLKGHTAGYPAWRCHKSNVGGCGKTFGERAMRTLFAQAHGRQPTGAPGLHSVPAASDNDLAKTVAALAKRMDVTEKRLSSLTAENSRLRLENMRLQRELDRLRATPARNDSPAQTRASPAPPTIDVVPASSASPATRQPAVDIPTGNTRQNTRPMTWARVAALPRTEITADNWESIAAAHGPPTQRQRRAAQQAGFELIAIRGFHRKPLGIVRQVLRAIGVNTRDVADIGFVGTSVVELIVRNGASGIIRTAFASSKTMSIVADYDPLSPSLRTLAAGTRPTKVAVEAFIRRIEFQQGRMTNPVVAAYLSQRIGEARRRLETPSAPHREVVSSGEMDIDTTTDDELATTTPATGAGSTPSGTVATANALTSTPNNNQAHPNDLATTDNRGRDLE
ncbi:hypothetical protein RI367_000955 [Sorochytrium milnesiophthora]